jgi:hypothetical protein
MLEDLQSAADITGHVDALLKRADAYDRFPTPVDDIVAAAGLTEAPDFVLDQSALVLLPKQLRIAMRRASRKLQGALDRRERVVHVTDLVAHEGKRRFVKLHEVTHDLLPHQQQLVYADDRETLSPTSRALFEREANQGAAELLFQRTAFTRDARGLAVGPAAVVHLADRYGSSLHAAFRRYAETHHQPVLVIRLHAVRNSDGSYTRYEQPCSPGWSKRFGRPSCPRQLQPAQYPFLAAIDNPVDQVIVHDINGEPVQVSVKAFDNTYSHFLLLWVPAAHKLLRPKAVRLR